MFHNDCAGGDIVWKLRKKRRKQRKKWIHKYIFSYWEYICFKASSKIILNNKVIFVALRYTCFTGSVILGVKKVLEREKPQKKLFIAWVWARSHGLGVGSFSVAEQTRKLTGNYPELCWQTWQKKTQDFYSIWIC